MTPWAGAGAAAVLAIAGCVVNHPYPDAWTPLPAPPTRDCHHFQGEYQDRGEFPGYENRPSLTLELFGSGTPWGRATRVSLSLPRSDTLEVTVWEGASALFARTLSAEAGDFACDAGQLVVRDQRGFAGAGVGGFEKVTITLGLTDDHLVAQVKQMAAGLVLIVPAAGSTTSWYRFPRVRRMGADRPP